MPAAALAYGFASTFPLKELGPVFAGTTVRTSKKQIVADYGGGGIAVAFDFGALVFINVGAEERARVIAAVRAKLPEEPHAPLEEDFAIDVRDGARAQKTRERMALSLLALAPAEAEQMPMIADKRRELMFV